jgi:(1->4)-alpha-D-glucan 1-alpha-D-glucosylmutase
MRIPRCTYRFQLHAGFTFDDLAELLPYLGILGVSDCYSSPIFRPTPGSRHGYDVCDYQLINPELGGDEALVRLADRLRENNLGFLLDFVPNHMGIDGPFNRWWRDVLEHGLHSTYASFFDIHWRDHHDPDKSRVFVPLLPEHYGVLLEQGKLRLVYEDGELALVHEGTRFPLRPKTYTEILRLIAPDEANIQEPAATEPNEPKKRLARLLAQTPAMHAALERCLQHLNGTPGDPSSFDTLDRLIDNQHYRLARWQAGAHGTNYRRFFAIDTLVGLHMEDPRVFEETHARLRELIRNGTVTGLRIDHVDGLRDPEGYLERLQNLANTAFEEDHAAPKKSFYVLVEKILAEGEFLPSSWASPGTTGYEFIGQLAGLFTDARNEAAFAKIYANFTERHESFEEVVYEKKKLILDEMFANTVLTLATTLQERIAIDRRWRDLTLAELTTAIRELLAGFRVYRTYRRHGPVSEVDRAEIEHAASVALSRNQRAEPAVIRFVRDVLLGDYPEPAAIPSHRNGINEWALTFQQYTGAVTAKAVEDTAYYTFNRLIALNEVGGTPGLFGTDIEAFHQANTARLALAPHTMLTTSTHDTKVSEDIRARLYALSEIPEEWRAWLDDWHVLNAGHKTIINGRAAPDADEEYRLYQTLLGAWPLPPTEPDDRFRERIRSYLRKAVNEAKVNTSILHPNEPWLEACDRFVNALLAPGGTFVTRIQPAAARLARLGMINSLAQVVLKLTVPGVPDIYQGNEAWDFSLVDPDNRRDVDYSVLRKLADSSATASPGELFSRWETGEIKLDVTRRLLRFRHEHPQLFSAGTYTPLEISGGFADHVVGFIREEGDERLLVLVPRLPSSLPWPPIGTAWADTRAAVGASAAAIPWTNLLSGSDIILDQTIMLADAFAELPVAVLHARRA